MVSVTVSARLVSIHPLPTPWQPLSSAPGIGVFGGSSAPRPSPQETRKKSEEVRMREEQKLKLKGKGKTVD